MPPASATALDAARRGCGAWRIAAVATATMLLGAHLARHGRLGAHHLGGLRDLLRGDRAVPSPRLLPMRVNARWVTSSRS